MKVLKFRDYETNEKLWFLLNVLQDPRLIKWMLINATSPTQPT
jgi:hypothetical protein